jgi:hypothetical protein
LLARLAGRERAKTSLVLRAHLSNGAEVAEGIAGLSLLSAPAKADGEFSFVCGKPQLMQAVAALRKHAKSGVITAEATDYIFETSDPLVAAFEKAIRR